MNKSIKVIAVILVACLIIAVPFLVRENMPDGISLPSGDEDILNAIEDADVPDTTPDEALSEALDDDLQIESAEEIEEKVEAETKAEVEPKAEVGAELKDIPESERTIEVESSDVPQVEKETEVSSEEKVENNAVEGSTCSLTINCQSVLDNMDELKESKKGIVPKDGIIFQAQNIEFNDGESAFDVLQRELQKNEIHLDYVKAPFYDSVYIKGIGNLYEFDCGNMSGWLYRVNGEKQSYGCSKYKLKDNDKIEFHYTCNYLDEM